MQFSNQVLKYIASDITAYFSGSKAGEPDVDIIGDAVVIKNYPLPKKFGEKTIPLLLILSGFPELAPAGIYIPTKHPDIMDFKKIFWTTEGDVGFSERVETLGYEGWTWMCNGYRALSSHDGKWRYCHTTKNGNDSLATLLAAFYATISSKK
jgi:hypothetical protein